MVHLLKIKEPKYIKLDGPEADVHSIVPMLYPLGISIKNNLRSKSPRSVNTIQSVKTSKYWWQPETSMDNVVNLNLEETSVCHNSVRCCWLSQLQLSRLYTLDWIWIWTRNALTKSNKMILWWFNSVNILILLIGTNGVIIIIWIKLPLELIFHNLLSRKDKKYILGFSNFCVTPSGQLFHDNLSWRHNNLFFTQL